jgi:hypothetical protein
MNKFWVLLAVAVVGAVVLTQVDLNSDVIEWLAVNWNSRRGG